MSVCGVLLANFVLVCVLLSPVHTHTVLISDSSHQSASQDEPLASSLVEAGAGLSEAGLQPGPAYLKEILHWRNRRDAERSTWWKNLFKFGKKKDEDLVDSSSTQIHSYSPINHNPPEVSRSYVGRPAKLAQVQGVPGSTQPGPRYGGRPGVTLETPEPSNLTRLLGGFLPNTYFSRPRFRYPYYDRSGKGYLLYGYGDKELYEYSVFKPLEGYY